MTAEKGSQVDVDRQATSDDVRRIVGDVDDTVVVEILSNQPSLQDLTDAAIWARGDGDLDARERKELSATAIAVAEILTREEEELVQPEE
jgi:hypothetical protein